MFHRLKIGSVYSYKRSVTIKDIQVFTKLIGDYNPLHTDLDYAKKNNFENIVAHGMLSASFFSTLVGMYLPVRNCIYISQNLKFHSVLYPNQKITVIGKIVGKSDALKIVTLKTEVRNIQDQLIVDGEAKIKVLN